MRHTVCNTKSSWDFLMRRTVAIQNLLLRFPMRHTVCNTKSHPKMSWWDICPDETYSMQYQISSQDVLMRHTVCNTKSHPKMSWWDIQYATIYPKMSWWDIQYAIPKDFLMRHTVCNTKSPPKMSWWDIQYAIPNLIPRCPDETYSM